MELGKNILKIRKDNNLTQDDLAEKYYVTRQTISNWENGKSYPDLETLVKISDDFKISLDILLKEDNKMIKDISKKQNDYKWFKIFVIILNIIGIGCLIYFAIPYLRHDMSVHNPNAMLASYSWDSCGFILTLGLIPLLIANIMAYKFIDLKNNKIKLLYFIPSIICLIIVCHYLFIATDWKEEKVKEPIATMKCAINGNHYTYQIYEEDNGEFSVGMEDNDKMPLSVIDYTNKDTIINSIEKYYKSNGGMCP